MAVVGFASKLLENPPNILFKHSWLCAFIGALSHILATYQLTKQDFILTHTQERRHTIKAQGLGGAVKRDGADTLPSSFCFFLP